MTETRLLGPRLALRTYVAGITYNYLVLACRPLRYGRGGAGNSPLEQPKSVCYELRLMNKTRSSTESGYKQIKGLA